MSTNRIGLASLLSPVTPAPLAFSLQASALLGPTSEAMAIEIPSAQGGGYREGVCASQGPSVHQKAAQSPRQPKVARRAGLVFS